VKSKVGAHAAALGLTVTAPDDERRRWEGMSQAKMMRAVPRIDEEAATELERSLLALARVWDVRSREANRLEREMRALLEANRPSILELNGFGTVNGAAMAISAGENPGRFPTEAKFAKHCGAAPIPASTGRTSGKMRLNRGGDRKANRALHNAVTTRSKNDERTKAYIKKKTRDPHTSKKDAERCLVRYVCREAYHALTHPFEVSQRMRRQALREARLTAGLT
jgi:transposase